MSSRVSLIVRTLVVVTAGFALLVVGLSRATADEEGVAAGDRTAHTGSGAEGAIIQATHLISIPFGFNSILPLTDDGASVVASGEGGCTAGEAITIAFTVTQSTSGASASGLWNGACTGELQTWTSTSTPAPSPLFTVGAGEACAFAETRAGDSVTGTQNWCNDVLLTWHRLFLPHVHKP